MSKTWLVMILSLLILFIVCDCYAGGWMEIAKLFKGQSGQKILSFFKGMTKYVKLVVLLAFLKTVSWTKMILGAALLLIGGFMPKSKDEPKDTGDVKVEHKAFSLSFKGTARVALFVGGLILLAGAVIEGTGTKAEAREFQQKNNGITGIIVTQTQNSLVQVVAVQDSSPGFMAGIRQGDIVTKVNGYDLVPPEVSYPVPLATKEAGETMIVDFTRKGIPYRVNLVSK